MKKSTQVLVALLALVAAAAPAFAEDRLSLSGEMRVRGFYVDTVEYGEQRNEFFEQRLRLGGKLTVAEGILVNFRFDATDETWGLGEDAENSKDANRKAEMQWDKANLQIDKESFSLVAGQQEFSLGNDIVVNHLGAGLNATIAGTVPVTLMYTKLNEGGDTTDKNGSYDADLYAVAIAHAGKEYEASLFYARVNDAQGDYFTNDGDLAASDPILYTYTEVRANAVGLTYDGTFSNLELTTEFDYFFGDAESTLGNGDVIGTQLYVDAATKLGEQTTVSLSGFFAKGADQGEVQFTQLSDEQDWDPCTCGAMNGDYSILPSGGYEIFDFTGDDAGVLGAQLHADFELTKELTVMTSVLAFFPEAGENTAINNTLGGTVSAAYALYDNTTLSAQGSYSSSDSTGKDIDQYAVLTNLSVEF